MGFYEEFDQINKKQKDNNPKDLDKALFESEIINQIDIFIPTIEVCQGFFYNFVVNDQTIIIEKKDFKQEIVDRLELNVINLTDAEKEKAISLAYGYMSMKLSPNRNNQCINYTEQRKGMEAKSNTIQYKKIKSLVSYSA